MLDLTCSRVRRLRGSPLADCQLGLLGDLRRIGGSRPKWRGRIKDGLQLDAWSVRRKNVSSVLPQEPMTPTAILYPGVAMFSLTLGVMLRLGLARYTAIHDRTVSIKFFRAFNEGNQPERLHLLSRHMQNHFEIPPLFYAGILFTYASNSVTLVSVVLAWLFFFTRCVHTFIHLGANNVSARFFTFGVSLVFVAGIWASLLVSLLRSDA